MLVIYAWIKYKFLIGFVDKVVLIVGGGTSGWPKPWFTCNSWWLWSVHLCDCNCNSCILKGLSQPVFCSAKRPNLFIYLLLCQEANKLLASRRLVWLIVFALDCATRLLKALRFRPNLSFIACVVTITASQSLSSHSFSKHSRLKWKRCLLWARQHIEGQNIWRRNLESPLIVPCGDSVFLL